MLALTRTPHSSPENLPYLTQVQDITKSFHFSLPWRGADALIHCASSGRGGAEAYRAVYLEGLLNCIAGVQPRRTLFVSSTSVYGQTDGSWVTEESETKPDRETSQILLEAERVALACGGYVARLSGLYGPGRSVIREKFLQGEATIEGGEGRWINQIHRDDAAQALFHLYSRHIATGIYNVTDDTPATQRELYQGMAEYFSRPLPPEGEPNHQRKRAWTNKRVSNAKLRATGWQPAFPDYRSALPTLSPA